MTSSSVVRDSLGVGIATGTYGLSFGALAVTSGLSVAQACAMSLLMFTGASQFAFVGVIAAGGAGISAAGTAALLGVRNALYGLTLAPKLALSWRQRPWAAQVVIDESTAMTIGRQGVRESRLGFFTTGITIFVVWNLSTALGAVAGERIGDPRAWGLDAAVGAAFLALLWPRVRDRSSCTVAALCAAVALALVPATPSGVPVLAAGGVGVLVAALTHRGHHPTP